MRIAKTFLSATTIVAMALIGVGCKVGPNYTPPKTLSASAFGELNATVNTNEPVGEWWNSFHDAELNKLIGEALHSNLDLQIASMRIRESRAQRNLAAADLFPTVDATGSYTRSRGSKNVVLPLGGSSSGSGATNQAVSKQGFAPLAAQSGGASSGGSQNVGANPLSTPPSPFGQGGLPGATTDLYQVGFDASWEIDVFGGKRRTVEAAAAEAQATEEARRDLQVSVAAEVARDYLELRAAQERQRVAQENLRAQNEVARLTESKRDVGLTSQFDVTRAVAEAAATAASLPPLEAAERQMEHALATLVGKGPNELHSELKEAKPLPATPPEVPVGLPSDLLKRRPDIRESEREIAAANAHIGSATADLFPKFALIGSAGLDSSQPGNLFNWESRYFLISPTVTWRIFDAGRILANIQLQQANEQEAQLQYRNVILKALREVEDALVNYATEQTRRNHLNEQLQQNREALELARKRYDEGLSDFLNVLDAERQALQTEDQVAQSNAMVATDLVALYKSLGGGWK